ncbi:GNAT family N-acetyltransferase [Microbacterium radiodurans]|uniref:GNAT family N-acetyltransferase n=1 Tax=Microbacterium radiodurans TaxID=661398 RepID=A0A5J5ISH4_9MICO|nr:GNAT family N-acetyltransferase [Microbacterium radiodurans]KAA9084929.1 GNAT family N-acetyltransferase [Microbacterium radiodurans]
MQIEIDDSPARIQRDVVWAWLSSAAYWGRWRDRATVEAQLDAAWRLVGAYRSDTGAQIGFARAASDGASFAYLADVFVLDEHQGTGVGRGILRRMIDEGPGRDFRWSLFTRDAHSLYAEFGFAAPDETAMVRPAGPARR